MGVSGKTNLSRDRYSEDTWENTNQNQAGQRKALFDSEESKKILSALTGEVTDPNRPNYGAQAAGGYQSLLGTQGGVNPFVEQAISASNREADSALATQLAGVRAGAYRGGTGANMYGQGKMIADSMNTRAKDNALARIGAFDAGESRRMAGLQAGASGLSNLDSSRSLLAAQILALLRGEDVDMTSVGTATGGKSGTQSRTAQQASGGWGVNYG